MEQSQLNCIANFSRGIADDVLRDPYVHGKYRDVILLMTVLRRLDAVLEPRKQPVEYLTRLVADVATGKLDVRDAAARLPEELTEMQVADEVDEAVPEDAEQSARGDSDVAAVESES